MITLNKKDFLILLKKINVYNEKTIKVIIRDPMDHISMRYSGKIYDLNNLRILITIQPHFFVGTGVRLISLIETIDSYKITITK